MAQAIIIGAGIAGIAVAVRLALKGWEVTVLEANEFPGGKLSEVRMAGFRFDAGPSLFTLPTLVDALFETAGLDPRAFFQYRKLDLACRYFYEDGTVIDAHADPERLADEVEAKLGVPRQRLLAHLRAAKQKFELTKGIFLERSLHKARSYWQRDVWKALIHLPRLHLLRSMHAQNARQLQHPKLVQMFDRYATYNGSDPYAASAVLNLIPHLEHGIGAAFPVGGMVAITHSLVRLAERLGVRFEYGQWVKRIVVEGKSATGVEVGGERRRADVVVSNMDIVPTYRKLLAGQRAPERTLRQQRSSSALVFYWGIGRAFPQLDVHNIFFTDDYAAEFAGIFGEGGLHPDPTIYVHISAKLEAADAPAGTENWFVMINVPSDTGQDWDAIIATVRAQILEKLSRRLGTNIAPLILCEAILDPRSIAAKTSSHQGALYGASSNTPLSAFLRHANFSSAIQGLYFCGGSVHPGGGIPLCLLSARIVANLIPAAG